MADSNLNGHRLPETAEAGREADEYSGEVVALGLDYPAGFEVKRHHHQRSQLVFAARGVITVTAEQGSWVLPPLRALWVPAMVDHSIRTTGEVLLRTVYLATALLREQSERCQVLAVPSLLRELILEAVERGPMLYCEDGGARPSPLVELLLEELRAAQREPLLALHLPEGSDPRLRRLMRQLRRRPEDPATLHEWGRRVGASERTLARLFASEAGLSFRRWRQQLRLQRALELLAAGRSVSLVAGDVGYESLSAFITMFRRATGRTPSNYLGAAPRA